VNNCPDCANKGETFCAEPCPCADAACADGTKQCQAHFGTGFLCTKVGTGSFCVPQRGTCQSGLGRVGDSCTVKGPADCVSGTCLSYGKTALCSAACAKDSECGDPRSFRCCDKSGDFYDCGKRNAGNDGPASGAGVCAPNGGLFGDDCRPGRPPCQSGTCLDIGTARLCTVPCGTGDTCPTDFVCREAFSDTGTEKKAVKICFPDGGGAPDSDCTFGPAACSDRICIKKESGPVCSKPCEISEDCPAEWGCTEVTPLGKEEKIKACLPPGVTSP